MSKRAVCLLGVVFVALGLLAGGTHVINVVRAVPAYLADGGGPTPPPIPMHVVTSEPTYIADGGGPIPPPIPMHVMGSAV